MQELLGRGGPLLTLTIIDNLIFVKAGNWEIVTGNSVVQGGCK